MGEPRDRFLLLPGGGLASPRLGRRHWRVAGAGDEGEEEAIDVVNTEAQLDAMIEHRARQAEGARRRGEPDPVEEMWAASVRREQERKRREVRAEWYRYFCRLADSLRRSVQEFDRKAATLLEDDEKEAD
jgi:hypothetical protein